MIVGPLDQPLPAMKMPEKELESTQWARPTSKAHAMSIPDGQSVIETPCRLQANPGASLEPQRSGLSASIPSQKSQFRASSASDVANSDNSTHVPFCTKLPLTPLANADERPSSTLGNTLEPDVSKDDKDFEPGVKRPVELQPATIRKVSNSSSEMNSTARES